MVCQPSTARSVSVQGGSERSRRLPAPAALPLDWVCSGTENYIPYLTCFEGRLSGIKLVETHNSQFSLLPSKKPPVMEVALKRLIVPVNNQITHPQSSTRHASERETPREVRGTRCGVLELVLCEEAFAPSRRADSGPWPSASCYLYTRCQLPRGLVFTIIIIHI